MCGIAGFISKAMPSSERLAVAERMREQIMHRGPDGHDVWHQDSEAVLIHTRLAIVELSDLGRQPMRSAGGRFVITFNGEIYNHRVLRRRLEEAGTSFRGHSDTEVLINWIERFGVEDALKNIRGMFAFAAFDTKERLLHLGRDRIGEKPLYYGMIGSDFVFASELKPLIKYPGFSFAIHRRALNLYVKYSYVPAPLSIFEGISKLEPGHFLTYDLTKSGQIASSKCYWALGELALRERSTDVNEHDAVNRVEAKLTEVIAGQIAADVKVGCFLSGGIDSSLIAALAQKQMSSPLQTYTIGFREEAYNEAPMARKIAHHLGARHTEWIVNVGDCRDIIAELPTLFDEPFADSSQLPTTLVSRLTRNEVKVCLSGDGGDELFAGYNRYVWANRMHSKFKVLPSSVRGALASAILKISPDNWSSAFKVVPGLRALPNPGDKMAKLAAIMPASGHRELYDSLLSTWVHPDEILMNYEGEQLQMLPSEGMDFIEFMMLEDSHHYLPDDIMVKVDRATMSVGLESRAPLLDHELYELMWSLPLDLKMRGGKTKYLARKILGRHLPIEWMDRPKSGFGVPLEAWLRTDLKEWAGDTLSPDGLKGHGFFNIERVGQVFEEHMSGRRNWQHQLWNLLVFQSWYQHWKT